MTSYRNYRGARNRGMIDDAVDLNREIRHLQAARDGAGAEVNRLSKDLRASSGRLIALRAMRDEARALAAERKEIIDANEAEMIGLREELAAANVEVGEANARAHHAYSEARKALGEPDKTFPTREERDAAEKLPRFSEGGIVDPSPILTAEQWSDLKRLQADRAAGSTPSLWLNRAAHDAVGVLDPTLGTNEQRRAEAARQAREILTVRHKVTETVGETSTTETTEDAPLTEDVIRLAAYIYNNTVVSNRTLNDGPRTTEQNG